MIDSVEETIIRDGVVSVELPHYGRTPYGSHIAREHGAVSRARARRSVQARLGAEWSVGALLGRETYRGGPFRHGHNEARRYVVARVRE